MLDFFGFAEVLLSAITSIGDFLLVRCIPIPSSVFSIIVNALNSLGWSEAAEYFSVFIGSELSFAQLIFGPGLVAFLFIRFIKFLVAFL